MKHLMKPPTVKIHPLRSARAAAALALAAVACVVCLYAALGSAAAPALAARSRVAHVQYACSAPNSAKVPCRFTTPSGNIRCLWTPTPNNVACERVSTGRGWRLRPSGHAKAIKLSLGKRGQTLPRNQQVVFPESLSCQDTSTTMTCNQDYGFGEFKLTAKSSHGS
jgi:hypothetical protein